jgi:hypothetical protein
MDEPLIQFRVQFRGQRHVGGYQIRIRKDLAAGAPILILAPTAPGDRAGARWSESALASMRHTLRTTRGSEGVLGEPVTESYDLTKDVFREFAEIGDDTQLIAFANRCGFLGIEQAMTVSATTGHASHGELLSAWRREIAAVQLALENWHVGQSNEHYALLARLDVVELVNERLDQPLKLARDGDRYRLEVAPKTLLSFIWIELAQALAGAISVRRCLGGCGKWIVIKRSGPASRRRTCTPACRIRAHHRRVEARRLRKRMGVKKVAERLGIDVAIVEELLSGATKATKGLKSRGSKEGKRLTKTATLVTAV